MKTWSIVRQEKELVGKLSEDLSVSNTIAELLVKRGVKDYNSAKDFFRPNLISTHNPFLMKNMDIAVKRINQAKKHMSSSWEVTCQQWTYETHLAKLRKAHFTLLPCEQDEHRKYAGHNRLLDAISGGTVPIASPIPSYKSLKEVAVLSDHFVGSFVESLKSYNDISKNFEKRREKILSFYSLDLTISKYQNLFSSLID